MIIKWWQVCWTERVLLVPKIFGAKDLGFKKDPRGYFVCNQLGMQITTVITAIIWHPATRAGCSQIVWYLHTATAVICTHRTGSTCEGIISQAFSVQSFSLIRKSQTLGAKIYRPAGWPGMALTFWISVLSGVVHAEHKSLQYKSHNYCHHHLGREPEWVRALQGL